MALEPALIRSSTSLTQLSASPTFGSLSFAGSLAGSMTYERKQQRLPPVDPNAREEAARQSYEGCVEAAKVATDKAKTFL